MYPAVTLRTAEQPAMSSWSKKTPSWRKAASTAGTAPSKPPTIPFSSLGNTAIPPKVTRCTGGQSNTGGTCYDNTVCIGEGGLVEEEVFAAYAPLGTASDNILIIEDATVRGNAGAVNAYAGGVYTQGTGNELHLLGNAIVTGGAGAHFDGWQENQTRGFDGLVHIRETATVGSLSGFDHLVI